MLCGRTKIRRFSAYLSHFSKIIFERGLFRQFQRSKSLDAAVLARLQTLPMTSLAMPEFFSMRSSGQVHLVVSRLLFE
jgi:hypothetical protein